MNDIVNLIVSNGIGVACITYFMFRDYKFMTTMQDTLTALRESLDVIEKMLLERGFDNGKTERR